MSAQRPSIPLRPTSPQLLLEVLQGICPGFTVDLEAYGDTDLRFHPIMMDFATFFGRARRALTRAQLEALGLVFNQAVAEDDMLENAVSTCFLEHLRQIAGYEILAPFLSAHAKSKIDLVWQSERPNPLPRHKKP